MDKVLHRLSTTAVRWRDRFFEALGFVPSAELYAMREAYNDELCERLMLKQDYENLYEDYCKALETPAQRPGYVIVPCVARMQVRKREDSLPDEYFKKGLRESLMRAVEEMVIYRKEETPEEIVWYARLNVAVEEGET